VSNDPCVSSTEPRVTHRPVCPSPGRISRFSARPSGSSRSSRCTRRVRCPGKSSSGVLSGFPCEWSRIRPIDSSTHLERELHSVDFRRQILLVSLLVGVLEQLEAVVLLRQPDAVSDDVVSRSRVTQPGAVVLVDRLEEHWLAHGVQHAVCGWRAERVSEKRISAELMSTMNPSRVVNE
jgi:hypothetical protein